VEIKTKYLPVLLAFSAIVVEACAAFFSVYGLTKLFSGAILAVAIMATSLEIAKVVSATYLYRRWATMNKIFRVYFTGAVFILMIITSLGIYGFLNNAFQSSTLGINKETTALTIYEDEIERLKESNVLLRSDRETYQKALNDELSGLIVKEESRYYDANKRRDALNRYQPFITEKDSLLTLNNSKISALTDSVSALKVKMVDTGVEVGPIVFVARAFDTDITTVVQYLIILFIVVFDPLALALVVAFNQMILEKYFDKTPQIESKSIPVEIKQDGMNWQGIKQSSTVPLPPAVSDIIIDVPTVESVPPPSPAPTSAPLPIVESSEPKPDQNPPTNPSGGPPVNNPVNTSSF